MSYVEEYYQTHDEDKRLSSKHGQVEYLTTQKYIHDYIEECNGTRILEVGAGTGRYSVALAKEGFVVTALELVEHNLDVLRKKLDGTEKIDVMQGNALDLSKFEDNTFDIVLVLGPMYHLYTDNDKLKALTEAVRVTKQGGYILVAYCMNEKTVLDMAFCQGLVHEMQEDSCLMADWHLAGNPENLFTMYRTEEIADLDSRISARRIKFIAADGQTAFIKNSIDAMDDKTFEKYMEYHLATCERQDLIGASNHTLDILRKD